MSTHPAGADRVAGPGTAVRVRLRVTLVEPGRGRARHDVLVDAVAGSTAAELAAELAFELAAELAAHVGGTGTPSLAVDGRAVPDDCLIGMPPLLDGVVLAVGRASASRRPRPLGGDPPFESGRPGGLALDVVDGPDAGHVFALPLGTHRLGRGAECALRVNDPDVSRVHAAIAVERGGVRVTDLGSTNGTALGDAPVGHQPQPLRPGSRLRVGASTLRLRQGDGPSAATRPDGLGHVLVNRRPRVDAPHPQPTIAFPDPGPATRRSPLPVLAMLVPLLLSGVLAAVLRSPTMLLFGLASPVLLLGGWLSERRGARGRHRSSDTALRVDLAAAGAQLSAALDEEAAWLRRGHPDPAEVLGTVETRAGRLWERRPVDQDGLVVRLGAGRCPARVRVTGSSAPDQVVLDDVPVTSDLRRLGVLGVAGPRALVLGSARSIVAQLATWHSPLDLRVSVLMDDPAAGEDWAWVRLLPHAGATATAPARDRSRSLPDLAAHSGDDALTRSVAELVEAVRERETRPVGDRPPRRPHLVVLVDGAARLRTVPGLSAVLDRGPAVDIHVLALDTTRERLPVEAKGVLSLVSATSAWLELAEATGPQAPAEPQLPGEPQPCSEPQLPGEPQPRGEPAVRAASSRVGQALTPDTPGPSWGERVGRALAPLRDATPGQADERLPRTVRLLDLLPPGVVDPDALAEIWRRTPASTVATLGLGADGPLAVDLRLDGPHALVAGTTGAGKSELLQTLIASLAVANRPDELALVLVDYKGGAAFRECAALPHTVGVVTDLDEHLTERALTSLGAELRRRERLLAEAGAVDIDDYRCRAPSAGSTLIPRLLIVIDELRVLAEELPDFVHGLVRLAAVGRSLGVHLVLATQRPGGIVSPEIRANVSLRIALRVRDRADSTDVVDAPDAASIPARTPGRALLRGAATPLTAFQTARVTGCAPPSRRVTVTRWPAGSERAPGPARHTDAPAGTRSDLGDVVAAARAAAERNGIRPPAPPWLPPLPDLVPLETLAAMAGAVTLGLRDDPALQSQTPATWDLDEGGHLGIAGGPRSGRSTALRTVAGALTGTLGPEDLHLYAVGAGLGSALAGLPHLAAAADADDTAFVDLVVTRLRALVRERQQHLASAGATTLREHRERAAAAGSDPLPWLVLLVDGWESLAQSLATVDHGARVQDLLALLREGTASGLRVALSGERAVLSGPLPALLGTRLVLRVSDPLELALAGIPARAVPRRQPPGRAVDLRTLHEVQLALLGDDPAPAAQAARLALLARRHTGVHVAAGRLPRPVLALPTLVRRPAVTGGTRELAVVGVSEGDLAPVGLRPGRGHRRVVVVGPARSGRTTALSTLAGSLLACGHPVAVIGRDLAELCGRLTVDAFAPQARDGLIGLRQEHPDLALLVDDAERIVGTPVEAVVREIARRVDEDGGVLVVATSAAGVGAFGTVPAELARARTGVLLSPAAQDGEAFGVRLTGVPGARVPGRGLLVRDGEVVRVQVALPD